MIGRASRRFLFSRGIRRKPGRTLSLHLSVWRQRQRLAELSDHELRDIGVLRSEADAEARRPIWDLRDVI